MQRKLATQGWMAVVMVVCGVSFACTEPPTETRNALAGGRVLIAPGAGLAGARISIGQIDRFSKSAEIYKHLGVVVTDEHGDFESVPTGLNGGLLLFEVSGGAFTDPISGTRIQLDASAKLRALHYLDLFEDRSTSMLITPIHSLVEARFRYKLPLLQDPFAAAADAYQHLNAHFGALNWDTVRPADLDQPATSPTDEVRAAFVLGGLAVLADDVRLASESTPQVANVITLEHAFEQDLGDAWLDGNDDNDLAEGTGLEIGPCPPPRESCSVTPGTCALGTCRPSCQIYANTYRTLLAGATAKFIGTREFPSVWNHTTLGSQDVRTVLDGIGKNSDPDLFGQTCFETIDRIPPTIVWLAPAAEVTDVKGGLVASISSVDDSGNAPVASFLDHADEDGDRGNSVARTTVATHQLGDGDLTITAMAIDLTGNVQRATRTFQVDNTVPVLTLDDTGFYKDARAWWTSTSGRTLRGTITEANLRAVTVQVGAQSIAATVAGSAWSVELPAGAISSAGTTVELRAVDRAGNVATRAQVLRLDDTAPTFGALPTAVKDERSDVVGFVGVEPAHTHSGPAVTLGGAGCPDVYKYAYLLDESSPPWGGELGARNPLRWSLTLDDDGVGIDPATVAYRVRSVATGEVLRDWTPTPGVDAGGGARRFDVSLYRAGTDAIAALGTTEGALELELRGSDRFGHLATGARCWTHHPLAAPLHVGEAYTPGLGGHPAHAKSLNAHGLESTRIQDLSSLLLNDDSAGASTMDAIVSNGTAEVVYLRVQLTAPTTANVTRTFSVAYHAGAAQVVDLDCDEAPADCAAVPGLVSVPETFPAMPTPFEVRLFTADATGAPLVEVPPCSEPGCINTARVRTYRLDGRSSTAAIPRFVLSAWLEHAEKLRPSGGSYVASPPFVEFTQAGTRYTGKQSAVTYCTRTTQRGIPRVTYCIEQTTYQRRQSVDRATIDLGGMMSESAASVTSIAAPHPTHQPIIQVDPWRYSTNEQ